MRIEAAVCRKSWILNAGLRSVEIHGVDVYDPTTAQVRSSSTDDIAAWFIDTNDNSESLFVRHAYFTGADDPFKQLSRALLHGENTVRDLSIYSATALMEAFVENFAYYTLDADLLQTIRPKTHAFFVKAYPKTVASKP